MFFKHLPLARSSCGMTWVGGMFVIALISRKAFTVRRLRPLKSKPLILRNLPITLKILYVVI